MTTIRPALESDVEEATTLHLASWSQLCRSLGLPPEGESPLDSPLVPTLVAEGIEGMQGFAMVRGDELVKLYVHPDAQGQGVGRALLRAAIDIGARTLTVDAGNARARTLYQSEGFHQDGEPFAGKRFSGSLLVNYTLRP